MRTAPDRPRRRPLLAAAGAGLTAVLLAGAAVALGADGAGPAPVAAPEPVAERVAAPVPVATVVGTGPDGRLPWQQPLRVAAARGTVVQVDGRDPDGRPVRGSVGADGTWTSPAPTFPLSDYALTAVVRDAGGTTHRLPLRVRTTPATAFVKARLSPGDGAVVGVGMPVVLDLDRPVRDPAARAALERRLTVTATPATAGSWRWMHDRQLHWRPAQFWQPGTQVRVVADLHRLPLPGGVWGQGRRTSDFRIGAALVSTVDVARHTMTVTRDGKVLRVLKASMGKPQYPTRNGTHLVLEKNASRVMDSDTVGLPGEYETKVDWAVRITYSGTFTHSAPWSVKDQGVRNVSHGCINLSPADAKWFYDLARRGDVVKVVGSTQGPKLDDPGAADWNLTYDQWRAGSALR